MRNGLGGGETTTCHHSLAVLQCGAVQICHSEPKIHLARGQGREKEKMEIRGRERENECERGLWRDAETVESVVLRTVLYCAFLPSSWDHPEHEHFFNHSRESRAEWRTRVTLLRLLTHAPPSLSLDIATPHSSMSPALHMSPSFPSPFL